MRILSILLVLFFTHISTAQKTQYPHHPEWWTEDYEEISRPPYTIVADLSDNRIRVYDSETGEVKFSAYCEGSHRGTGFDSGSYRTPTGDFFFVKQSGHSFGNVLRLYSKERHKESGYYQGFRRGILVHKEVGRRGQSMGCINLANASDMNRLFRMAISKYDTLIIQK